MGARVDERAPNGVSMDSHPSSLDLGDNEIQICPVLLGQRATSIAFPLLGIVAVLLCYCKYPRLWYCRHGLGFLVADGPIRLT